MTSYGFTGTRKGLTLSQRENLRRFLGKRQPGEVHHGDCVGADAQFHADVAATLPACRIVLHPPADPKLRAWTQGEAEWPPKPYLVRDADIVGEADLLIAAPGECAERQRSGTWATVRMARQRGIPIVLLFPDGTAAVENAPKKAPR